ncbi:MAG: hypothetical protein ACPHCJ_03825 [Oceanococcaceae bacterium]
MQDITQLHISGLDDSRPPRLRKEPYIDLYFTLSEKAPSAWCDLFNESLKRGGVPARVDPDAGQFIETWVRKPEEVPAALLRLKQGVKTTTETYLARLLAAREAERQRSKKPEDSGEQGRLNQILSELNFDQP